MLQIKSPHRQRKKEKEVRREDEKGAGIDDEDKGMVDYVSKVVRRDYVELIKIWNSIGLSTDKKHDEALVLQQEIEEIFKVRPKDYP
jgi:hypothetical protein